MKLINIRKIYKNKNNIIVALKNINLEFNTAGLITILGPSGCGKTTLLNIISGEEKKFEGELKDVANVYYLTQDFLLFESMSILDNLKIASDNIETITNYLKKFGLWELRNKKIKKCSNGQKKRVQFIRALLNNPDLLLCDEPTASLNYENSKILMEALKDVSSKIPVIVVTHDIALAEKYSDRIIKMGKGIIESDDQKLELPLYKTNSMSLTKNVYATFQLVVREFKSRFFEHILMISMYLLSSFFLYTIINFYENVQEQSSFFGKFKTGANIVESVPKDMTLKQDDTRVVYRDFDVISYNEVVEITQLSNDIIGIEAFYNSDIYVRDTDTAIDIKIINDKVFKKTDFPLRLFDQEKHYSYDKPLNLAFLLGMGEIEKIEKYEKNYKVYHTQLGSYPSLVDAKLYEVYRNDYGISLVDLFNVETIPLSYGTYPANKNEVILAKDAADILMIQDGYKNYEELIGKTFHIGIESQQNHDVYNYYYNPCNLDDKLKACSYYLLDSQRYIDRFEVKIAGISNIETDNLNLVFMNNELAKNIVFDYYVEDYDQLYFDYVRFVLNPSADTNKFIELLNSKIPMAESRFKVFDNFSNREDIPLYKQPSTFFLFCVLIFSIFISLIILLYIFMKTRFTKEHRIMNMLRYSSKLEKILHVGLISVASFGIFLFMHPILFKLVNKAAKLFYFDYLLSFNFHLIGSSFLLVFIVGIFIELMLDWRCTYDKNIWRK